MINFRNDNKFGLLINYYMASEDLLYIAQKTIFMFFCLFVYFLP